MLGRALRLIQVVWQTRGACDGITRCSMRGDANRTWK